MAEGVWRVPNDLAERGYQYDAQRQGGGVAVDLKSHLPSSGRPRVIGATWLDQQLIGAARGWATWALAARSKTHCNSVPTSWPSRGCRAARPARILAPNLLNTLRGQEVDVAAKAIAAESGLTHHPVSDGERVTGTYRRNLQLASGRFAMLDNGMGFSLVPWKPVIEQRLGRH